jgi:glc operon protein GlcG
MSSSVELTPGKAKAAALFRKSTQSSAQQLTQMRGALPIVVNGETVGAVGISANTPVHDQKIATGTLLAVVC